jgi:isopenicillin N synthase-like dioxygenase
MSQAAVDLGTGTSIPIVDFAGFPGGEGTTRTAIAASIRRAFEDFGFFYLRNHGVSQQILDALFAESCAFFARPLETKTAASGYSAPGYSALDPTRPADLKEGFRVYPLRDLAPGHWPADPPAFRAALLGYYRAATATCSQVMRAVAVALELPEDYFVAAHDPHGGSAMLLHYPPLDGPPADGQFRSGAHTDYGSITLLFHGGPAEGLEIQGPARTWLPVPSVPGTAIVNAGDLLQRWTNDQLRSVLHRVVAPTGSAATRSRYSAVLFYQPRYDAIITCLDVCQSQDRPSRYPPITAGQHIEGRIRDTRRTGY